MTTRANPGRLATLLKRRVRALDRLAISAALAACALVLVTFAVPRDEAWAAISVKVPTVLQLQLPAEVELGAHPRARVTLTSNGAPVTGQLISVRLGPRVSLQVTTGTDGTATADIERDLSAGTYDVTATFAGTPVYRSSSSAPLIFIVKPAVLTIATVPSMPDLPLVQVGSGAVLKTAADGAVHVTMAEVGNIALQLALPADGPALRLRLERWDDGSTDPLRSIRVPDTLRLTVGLQLLFPIRFAFSAADGAPLANTDVPLVVISDGAGAEQTLSGPPPYWLRANAITRLASGIVSTQAEYRVVSVPLDGADVVNRGQQRFFADQAKTVQLQLLVFNLSVQGRDAVLRTSSGSTVRITSATGAARVVTLDRDARATVRLPRGEYRLALGGGIGIPLSTPVALSRDQTVDILLISALDIVLAIAAGVTLALGLIVIGRPHVLRRRNGGPPVDPGNVDPPEPSWPASPQSVPRVRTDR